MIPTCPLGYISAYFNWSSFLFIPFSTITCLLYVLINLWTTYGWYLRELFMEAVKERTRASCFDWSKLSSISWSHHQRFEWGVGYMIDCYFNLYYDSAFSDQNMCIRFLSDSVVLYCLESRDQSSAKLEV